MNDLFFVFVIVKVCCFDCFFKMVYELQPGPRESPIQCFIKRDRATSTYFLYVGLVPCE